jgi:signal transduction histidine kinase
MPVIDSRDEVAIRVADTRVGIAAHRIPLLFERFSQIDSTIDRARGGWASGS